MQTDMWLAVGLGNPGAEYAGTRHSTGRMVAEALARRIGSPLRRVKGAHAHAAVGRLTIGGPRLATAVLDSYMNLSGGPTRALLHQYHLDLSHLIVVRDDLDLPFGEVRLRRGGGHGGHNGVRDIIAQVGSAEFVQVRCGIGRPRGRQDPADFVLARYSAAERPLVDEQVALAADLIGVLVTDGLQAAQQEYRRQMQLRAAAS